MRYTFVNRFHLSPDSMLTNCYTRRCLQQDEESRLMTARLTVAASKILREIRLKFLPSIRFYQLPRDLLYIYTT